MQWNRLFRGQSVAGSRSRPVRSSGWQRIGLSVATMAAAILFCSAPVRSLADGLPPGDEVYVENPNRSYTDVTSQVFFVGSQAYLYPNNPMPITIDYVVRHVFDQYGNLIGYITVPSGG